ATTTTRAPATASSACACSQFIDWAEPEQETSAGANGDNCKGRRPQPATRPPQVSIRAGTQGPLNFMQFHTFYIPAKGNAELEEELNHFLRSRSIVNVRKELVQDAGESYWSYCIEEMLGGKIKTIGKKKKETIDYREVLSDKDFALYSTLRDKRNELAKAEGMSMWNVAYNHQIASMAEDRPKTVADLKKIKDFGEKSIEKFGESFLKVVSDEESRKSD
ncbi:MAG: HRDC domain-containing protein, partial [Planctomycetes bacterium]|nr:HRDC domain-containing protein [Planctomycetota bacterium]